VNIKYLKEAPNGPTGSTDTVTDFEGNILIKTGFAEPYEPKPKRKPKAKTDKKDDSE